MRNCMLSRRSLPNISDWANADRTNIHAKPQMKVATAELEFSQVAISGAGPFRAEAKVLTAVWVNIW
jgi:hypothetical protein